ncbi:MAG: NHL repeat-containing protein [bacterium]
MRTFFVIPFVLLVSLFYIPKANGKTLPELTKLTSEQFDSILPIENSFNGIVQDRCTLYTWPRDIGFEHRSASNPLDKDEIARVIKEHSDYFFVRQSGNEWTGWIEKKYLRKNEHPDMQFKLEFTIGDSTGAGIVTSPMRVSEDNENLYILEVDRKLNYRIQRFNSSGEFLSFVNIPMKKRVRESGYGNWTSQKNTLMKVKDSCLFVPTETGIGKFTPDGKMLLEIKGNLIRPVAMDIASNGNIYMLDDETPSNRMDETDIFIKIYSPEGKFLKSFKPENFKNPTDIKITNNKIYLLGEKTKIKENTFYPISDNLPIYSDKGSIITKVKKGKQLTSSKINSSDSWKQINGQYFLKILLTDRDTGFAEAKMLMPVDNNVLYVFNQDEAKIEEITFKNIAKRTSRELAVKIANGTVFLHPIGSQSIDYHWQNVAIDKDENIYIIWRINLEDYWGTYLIKFNTKTSIVEGPFYTNQTVFYGESSRNVVPGEWDNDIEICKDGSVVFIDNHSRQVYILQDGKVRKAIKDTPKEEILHNPTAIALDKDENIYVSDFTINKIKKFAPSGKLVWTMGGFVSGREKAEEGKFDCVGDIAIDDSGYIYVADLKNRRAQKFDSGGKFILSFSVYTQEWPNFDIKFHKGELKTIIGEGVNGVNVYSRNGKFIRKDSLRRKEFFVSFSPYLAGIDKNDNRWEYYGPDRHTERGPLWPVIWVYNPDGKVIDGFTSEDFKNNLSTISDIEFDNKGNLWIADPGSYQIKKFSIIRGK